MDRDASAVKEFLLVIASGTLSLEAVTVLVFTFAGKFSLSVIFGALYGFAVMMLYYFLFARAISSAATDSNPEDAKKRLQASYSLRMFLLAILMGAGLLIWHFFGLLHWLPMLAAVVFPRISILFWQIVQKLNNKK